MHPVVPVPLVALSHCVGDLAQIPPFQVPGRAWADTPQDEGGNPGSCRTGQIRARAENGEVGGEERPAAGRPATRLGGLGIPHATLGPHGCTNARRLPFSAAPGSHSKRGRKPAGVRSRLPPALPA